MLLVLQLARTPAFANRLPACKTRAFVTRTREHVQWELRCTALVQLRCFGNFGWMCCAWRYCIAPLSPGVEIGVHLNLGYCLIYTNTEMPPLNFVPFPPSQLCALRSGWLGL